MKYVLMFHDVYNQNPNESGFTRGAANTYKIHIDNFKSYIEGFIKLSRTRNIPLSDIIFTFDDGGANTYQIAKELTERGCIGHFFIVTSCIGKPGFCKEDDLIKISQMGHIIGSHSHTHPINIAQLNKDKIYDEWQKSISILNRIIKKNIIEASIPEGNYSKDSGVILNKLGVTNIYTSNPTMTSKTINDTKIIGRFTIRENKNPLLYLDYLQKFSILRLKIRIRYILLKIIKTTMGDKFFLIRKIIKGV